MKKLFKIITLLLFVGVLNCSSDENMVNTNKEVLNSNHMMKSTDITDFDLTKENILNTEFGILHYYNSLSESNKFLFKDQYGSFSQIIIQPNGKFNYFNFDSKLELNFKSTFDEDLGYEIVDLTSYRLPPPSGSGCDCETTLALDMGLCLLSAAAIAASDGPLPFMDAAAVTYGTACMARAGISHENCVDNCNDN